MRKLSLKLELNDLLFDWFGDSIDVGCPKNWVMTGCQHGTQPCCLLVSWKTACWTNGLSWGMLARRKGNQRRPLRAWYRCMIAIQGKCIQKKRIYAILLTIQNRPVRSQPKELLSSDGLSVPGIMVLDGHSGSRCVDHLVVRRGRADGFLHVFTNTVIQDTAEDAAHGFSAAVMTAAQASSGTPGTNRLQAITHWWLSKRSCCWSLRHGGRRAPRSFGGCRWECKWQDMKLEWTDAQKHIGFKWFLDVSLYHVVC